MSIDSGAILILGGRSEIGMAVAERLARQTAGDPRTFVLAARRSDDLEAERARLLSAGADAVETVEFDAGSLESQSRVVADVLERHGAIGVAVPAFGLLGDQSRAEEDPVHAAQIVHVDYVAQVTVLTDLAREMRAQGRGQLVVFSSVAGIRVRRANYVYGSAKAGLDGFASGLADALAGTGVQLLLVRPGFVIGKMTEGMDPAPLSSTPDQVADAVLRGLTRRKRLIWVPGALRWMYVVARLVPQPIWRRLPR
ncbi:SDR family NAD(P)-dependent oxidoreductase [Speluncibacter jeojiensis]|uniref:SDR family NAD(P)-dependent oxidoreductase n=1 Tax=Speluncibacter jeojiensis TaxID=2710754 RepID=A0A9X4M2J7_9ACTN|nr:SDR family NAD(P)-dependent oxidoreductase [Corynebacteriales bacterium D3-21]